MPVVVEWDQEKAIIRQIITDPWTWEEFIGVRGRLAECLDGSREPAIIMIEVRTRALPGNTLSKYSELSDADMFHHPNMGGFIILSESRLVQALGDIFMRVYPSEGRKMWFVKSGADVPSVIEKIRAGKGVEAAYRSDA